MKTKNNLLSLALAIAVCSSVSARENIGKPPHPSVQRVMANGCTQDLGAAFLQINNVRMRVMDEGDMWWDQTANLQKYFVPASGKVSAEFAGSLWIGGLDAGGQLKVAAMTYRQNGEDFWAGPLDTATVSITVAECQAYDKLFYVTRKEVQNFVTLQNQATLTPDILNWPGNGNSITYGEAQFLAPFHDVNGDGIYEPDQGDYPGYDLTGKNASCSNELYGDATLWWVFNDEGNIHSETGGLAIGLEVRAQAFEFQTNDAINNATFYNYQVINRSSYSLNKTYFGVWDDFDLGNGGDDYTGCDVGRSMGIGYNGEATDPNGSGAFAGEAGYINYPPAIGLVFFHGPKADKNDTSCYVHNGLIGMAHFVYYNNDFSVIGNPQNSSHYYNYLKGLWTDGSPMTYGGTGYQSSSTTTNYMFPWIPAGCSGPTAINTDPTGCGTNRVIQNAEWDEQSAGNLFGDRRMIISAGPFTLGPGQVNYVTTGLVWDQASTPKNQFLPVGLIRSDADLAQALFNNCFKVLDGPDAPDVTIQELNKELIITISNSKTSNNYKESYKQRGPTIIYPPYKDTMYAFEGYQIFQCLDSTVTGSQVLDPTKARLVAECDVQNGVGQLVNYAFNQALGGNVPTLEVSGADKGIVHSFDIKTDLFQIDNIQTLVNDRPYYYLAVAYAYNNYLTYNPLGPDSLLKGQKLPYLQGSKNVKVYTGVPHIPEAQGYGTNQNSTYGEGLPITRLEGHGNGGNTIELDQNSISTIMQNSLNPADSSRMINPTYVGGQGPINVKVVDPLSVPKGTFELRMYPVPPKTKIDSTCRWKVYVKGGSDTVYSDTNIAYQNEQIIPQWGISIDIVDVGGPGFKAGTGSVNNGLLDSSCTMTFSDPTKNWLSGLQTASPGLNFMYWIRSGSYTDKVANGTYTNYPNDPNSYYQRVIGGTWGPYYLCSVSDGKLFCDNGPKYNGSDYSSLQRLSSVDVVITQDRSKWTRCPVLEEEDAPVLAQGGAAKLSPRKSPSVDMDGNYASAGAGPSSTPTDPNYINGTGMGWFPGYAINVSTGERLNMAFGEDSWLTQDNGRDMQWNPDSTIYRIDGTGSSGVASIFGVSSVFGGKHYIYVFGHNTPPHNVMPAYDAGKTAITLLSDGITGDKANVFGDAMWVNIPLLKSGHKLYECDVTVRLRIANSYAQSYGAQWSDVSKTNGNFPMYAFSTDGLEVDTNNSTAAKNALNLINVVPNPYYAYSSYESDRLDTRVRITNLPPKCTISIFTVNGTLVTVINKESPQTYIDWNLENQFNVPIASGMYLIHVAVPNVGERTLKWFGVLRPIDLNSY